MAERTVKVRLEAATAAYLAAMRQASAVTSEFARNVAGAGDVAEKGLQRVSRGALLMSGGLAVGLGLAGKAAIDWESAWAGVTKTVDGSAAQMADLQQGLRDMAKELPATHGEIAAVAEAAGALGVQRSAIESFTETMINLGETTDLTADQAATSMAQIANIMGTAHTDFDRLGATLVDLGNNGASTESEILELANRLAAAGKIAGLSEADVFAFASTLASVGVEAEAGGTALSKVFTRVRDAVIDGGESLDVFAQVAGTSAAEFARAFREDPEMAIELFIAGLDRMNLSGQSTTQVFKDLELNDERLKRSLLSTAGAGELLTEQLELGRQAWEENTALQTEAEKRYATTAAQMEILRNKASDLGITAGNFLLPAINGVVGGLDGMADGLASLPTPLQAVGVGLAGVSSAGLGIVGAVGILGPKVIEARNALMQMGTAGQFVGSNLGKISGALAGVGAAVAVGTYIYGEATKAAREYSDQVKGLAADLGAVAEGQASVNDVLSDFLSQNISDPADLEVLRAFGVTFDDLTAAIEAGGDVLDPFRQRIRELGVDLNGLDIGTLDNGINELSAGALGNLASALGVGIHQLEDFIDVIEDYDNAAQDAARTQLNEIASTDALSAARVRAVQVMAALAGQGDNYAWQLAQVESAAEGAGDAAGDATGPTKGLGDAQDTAAERAEKFEEALRDVTDAMRSQMDPLFAVQDAFEAHKEAQDAVKAAQLEALVAEMELDEAIQAHGRTSDEAALKSLELAAAQQKVTDAQSATARTALDVTVAARELRMRMEETGLSIEAAESQLRTWVDQGLLTEEQAFQVAQELRGVIGEADRIDGRNIRTTLTLDAQQFWAELAAASAAMRGSQITAQLGGASTAGPQIASGGLVPEYRAAGGLTFARPRGSDTVPAMLTPGEFVVRKQTVDQVGVGFLHSLNTYGSFRDLGPGGAGIDYGRLASALSKVAGPTTTMENTFIVPDPQAAADELVAAHRRVQLANA